MQAHNEGNSKFAAYVIDNVHDKTCLLGAMDMAIEAKSTTLLARLLMSENTIEGPLHVKWDEKPEGYKMNYGDKAFVAKAYEAANQTHRGQDMEALDFAQYRMKDALSSDLGSASSKIVALLLEEKDLVDGPIHCAFNEVKDNLPNFTCDQIVRIDNAYKLAGMVAEHTGEM